MILLIGRRMGSGVGPAEGGSLFVFPPHRRRADGSRGGERYRPCRTGSYRPAGVTTGWTRPRRKVEMTMTRAPTAVQASGISENQRNPQTAAKTI